jgi:hypothetical protein
MPSRSLVALLLPACLTVGFAGAAETPFTPEQIALYEKEVKPLLEANCLKCHGGEKTARTQAHQP